MVYFMEKPIDMDDLGVPPWIGNLRYVWPKAKWAGNHELWMLYKQKNIVMCAKMIGKFTVDMFMAYGWYIHYVPIMIIMEAATTWGVWPMATLAMLKTLELHFFRCYAGRTQATNWLPAIWHSHPRVMGKSMSCISKQQVFRFRFHIKCRNMSMGFPLSGFIRG